MQDVELLGLIVKFRKNAAKNRTHGKRVSYEPEDREAAVELVEELWAHGLSTYDAAQVLNVHVSTLEGWVERATRPGGKMYLAA